LTSKFFGLGECRIVMVNKVNRYWVLIFLLPLLYVVSYFGFRYGLTTAYDSDHVDQYDLLVDLSNQEGLNKIELDNNNYRYCKSSNGVMMLAFYMPFVMIDNKLNSTVYYESYEEAELVTLGKLNHLLDIAHTYENNHRNRVRARLAEVPPILSEAAVSKTDFIVVGASDEVVVIDAGTEHDVKVGDFFMIYRSSIEIGLVEIQEVRERRCVGYMDFGKQPDSNSPKKLPVKGDRALRQ
jgi:hypothetical protein